MNRTEPWDQVAVVLDGRKICHYECLLLNYSVNACSILHAHVSKIKIMYLKSLSNGLQNFKVARKFLLKRMKISNVILL